MKQAGNVPKAPGECLVVIGTRRRVLGPCNVLMRAICKSARFQKEIRCKLLRHEGKLCLAIKGRSRTPAAV